MPEHPDELLLLYLEDALTPVQKATLEDHLSRCKECSSELVGLRRMIATLKENKEAFCPESAEIVRFVEQGDDPDGLISKHLQGCPACSAVAEACRSAGAGERMPDRLWISLQTRLPVRAEGRSPHSQETRWVFFQLLRWWMRVPAIAAGAALAAVLLVVFLYPREYVAPNVGLSSIAWEGIPKPKVFQPRAAFILAFKGVPASPAQDLTDAVYRDLKPDMDLSTRFDIVPPAEIKRAVKAGRIVVDPAAMPETLESLREGLNVAAVAIITLEPAQTQYDVRVELFDSATGALLKEKTESGVSNSDLPERVRAMVFQMLLS